MHYQYHNYIIFSGNFHHNQAKDRETQSSYSINRSLFICTTAQAMNIRNSQACCWLYQYNIILTYYSSLAKRTTHYFQNYAGILGSGLISIIIETKSVNSQLYGM